jgi:protein gp37
VGTRAALRGHQQAEVPFFFKQWGGRTPKALGRELDGEVWDEMPAATAQ